MDLGRVVSFASNREVELACDSSSGRGVGQKGVSPVWLGSLEGDTLDQTWSQH